MRILVVDDEYVSRMKLQKLLSAYGQCDMASDGKEALKMFAEAHRQWKSYDLITLDVNMPELKGQDVLAKIRQWEGSRKGAEADAGAKVIMITVSGDRNDVFSSFREGCEMYLKKPITPERLKDSLRRLGIIE